MKCKNKDLQAFSKDGGNTEMHKNNPLVNNAICVCH